jgi:hypothetical protein
VERGVGGMRAREVIHLAAKQGAGPRVGWDDAGRHATGPHPFNYFPFAPPIALSCVMLPPHPKPPARSRRAEPEPAPPVCRTC